MTGDFSADWLRLREPADADARAADLVDLVRPLLDPPIVIRDLGCGTGSLGRWLAPRLPGPQHWVLVDRDPALLNQAAATLPRRAADGAPVTAEARLGDVTALGAADLAGTSLVTCSALLDLLTAGEVAGIAEALAAAATPALFTLSVAGEVRFDPPDSLDSVVAAAFDDHQRRTVAGRRLLGPDAPAVAARALEARGARVTVRPSPWRLGPSRLGPSRLGPSRLGPSRLGPSRLGPSRLGPDRTDLAAAWLRGWTAAAIEQRPDLVLDAYVEDRLAALAAGTVTVSVGHRDLLAAFPASSPITERVHQSRRGRRNAG